jgi:2'-5' RNA ligase
VVSLARAAFAANWLVTSRLLRSGGWVGTQELAEVGRPRFLTTVVRLPPDLTAQLVGLAAPLVELQPEHYLYPAESVHMTILALADARGVEDEIRAVAERHHAFTVEIGGLNVSRRTVFAEIYPEDQGLASLRRELGAVAGAHAPRWRRTPRWLAHATVVRFARSIDSGLLNEVGERRKAQLGRFTVTEFELVHADKVLSLGGTRSLARFRLGAGMLPGAR